MKVSDGFVSIGHLLANKEASNYVQTLRHFCTVMFCNMDEDMIHKSTGFYRYDQFFSSVDVSVESFAKFVSGILRKHETDTFELQLLVEKLAWDLVKYDFDHFSCSKLDRKNDLFRLFCLFNRFCKSDVIPMVMPEKAACFLLKEINVPLPAEDGNKVQGEMTLPQFLQVICQSKNSVVIKNIKKLYDEHVRDVIKEGRVKYRIMEKGLVGQEKAIRTIAVTSRNLVIYDDENDADLDVPLKKEPTGKVLHHVPLIDTETKVLKGIFGKNKMYLQLVSKSKTVPMIEMIFDQSKDHFDLYSWSQAIQEAVYSTQANTNRLSKTYLRLGLDKFLEAARQESIQTRRSSDPLSPTLVHNAAKKVSLEMMGRSTSETFLLRQNESEVFTFEGGEPPSPTSSSKSSSKSVISQGSERLKRLSNLPAAFQMLKSRSSSGSGSTDSLSSSKEVVDSGLSTPGERRKRQQQVRERSLLQGDSSWITKTESSPTLNITRTF